MIPTSLKLRADQIKRVKDWRNTLKKYDDYEDACCSSDVEFVLYATGIGDVIKARCQGKEICLSIDDDGELMPA